MFYRVERRSEVELENQYQFKSLWYFGTQSSKPFISETTQLIFKKCKRSQNYSIFTLHVFFFTDEVISVRQRRPILSNLSNFAKEIFLKRLRISTI